MVVSLVGQSAGLWIQRSWVRVPHFHPNTKDTRVNRVSFFYYYIIIKRNTMNSKTIGNITEIETLLAFAKMGFTVLQPYGDNARYDLVVEKHDGTFVRIQCKTSKSKDDGASFAFSGRSTHYRDGICVSHTYTKKEIDYFATAFNGKCYLVPVEECNNMFKLRIFPAGNNQIKDIHWAKDYRIDVVAKNW